MVLLDPHFDGVLDVLRDLGGVEVRAWTPERLRGVGAFVEVDAVAGRAVVGIEVLQDVSAISVVPHLQKEGGGST